MVDFQLKCNREHPTCDQCLKRSREKECSYLPPPKPIRRTKDLRARVRQLEALVTQLAHEKDGAANAATGDGSPNASENPAGLPCQCGSSVTQTSVSRTESNEDQDANEDEVSLGKLNLSSGGTAYVGSAHWSTILQEVYTNPHLRYSARLVI
jgi:hypothetical protein